MVIPAGTLARPARIWPVLARQSPKNGSPKAPIWGGKIFFPRAAPEGLGRYGIGFRGNWGRRKRFPRRKNVLGALWGGSEKKNFSTSNTFLGPPGDPPPGVRLGPSLAGPQTCVLSGTLFSFSSGWNWLKSAQGLGGTAEMIKAIFVFRKHAKKVRKHGHAGGHSGPCLLYTSPSPRD